MPAGQTFRLIRAQRQQQRQFDPTLLGLQLTDETSLNITPENPGTGYLRRYQGRPQYAQWPVLSRLDATGLERADQPDIDLQPWSPPTATWQRYRGRPAAAQWPTYARMQATDLQLADETALNTVPEWVPPWYRGRAPIAQWRQFTPVDLTPFITPLPDQDVNLVPVAARMWRPPSRAELQQWPVFSRLQATDLQLADETALNTVPDWTPPWYRGPRPQAQWRQFTAVDLTPFTGGLPDQDVNLVPVSARMWRPASRAGYQQAVYFDLSGLALQLADQDITFDPVNARPPRGNAPAATQWKQFAYTDPSFLIPALPDQDVNLRPTWALGSAVYAVRKGRQQWYQDVNYDLTQLAVAQDVNLVPSWMAANTWIARRAGRPTWQQFTPTDPSGIELDDQDVTLIPSWAALMGGILARRFGRAERLQPVYHDLAGLALQLADQDVRLVPVVAPRSTYLRYQGKQRWYVRVVYPGEILLVLGLAGRTRTARISSATVAATLTSTVAGESITSATTTENLP